MEGKNVFITGANAGIGLATAKLLAAKGANVYVHARSEEKAKATVAEIGTTKGKVGYFTADLSSQSQVREMATKIAEELPVIDVFVSNAGAFFSDYGETEDGIERQFAINHLAPFLLIEKLLPNLKKADKARVVMVSSEANQRFSKLDFNNLGFKDNYGTGLDKAYAQSKAANILFAKEFTRRYFEETSITCNALHPGVVKTGIANKNSSFLVNTLWSVLKPFMLSLEKGAATSVYLASSPEVAGVSGNYYIKYKEKKSGKLTYDKTVAKKLWEVSAKLTGTN